VVDAATRQRFVAIAAARILGTRGVVVGVDISAGMLAEATGRSIPLGSRTASGCTATRRT